LVAGVGVGVLVGVVPPLLRGLGAPALKSAALLLVSVAPLPARRSAVVLLGAGAGPLLAGVLLPVLPAWAIYGGSGLVLAAMALALAAPGRRRLATPPPIR